MNDIRWSEEQEAIFDAIENGDGNLLARARAGAGKSTTLVEAARRRAAKGLKERVLFAAFGKRNAAELAERLAGSDVEAKTYHSLGARFCYRNLASCRVDNGRGYRLARMSVGDDAPYDAIKVVRNVASMAKQVAPRELDVASFVRFCFEHDLVPPDLDYPVEGIARAAIAALELACEPDGTIDFDDMVFLPVAMGWVRPITDVVIIDEAQDTSEVQLRLLRAACTPGGRVIFVGDDRQCIPAGERVLTPSGLIAIETLRIGDAVLSVKGGRTVETTIAHKTQTVRSEAYSFALDNGHTFRATADHVCFAAIDDPKGSFVYLMYRHDMGFRIGVSRTAGASGDNFVVRTNQEQAERLWVLDWFETYREAAKLEAALSLRYRIPKEPFKARAKMWADAKDTTELFAEFGQNGWALLKDRGIGFHHPNYVAKASDRGRVAINLSVGHKDWHQVSVESRVVDPSVASALGFLPVGDSCTLRLRRTFRQLRDARAFADRLARDLAAHDAYVVESLACTDGHRRMLAVQAECVNVGMRVPFVNDTGEIETAAIISRTKQPAGICYDLEIQDHGTFIVEGVVVHNCAYRFRGVSLGVLDDLKRDLNAEELKLTISRRCPRLVVERARYMVPDYRAAPDAIEGSVLTVAYEDVIRSIGPGDLVVSRTNAPLVGACLSLIRSGVAARVQGRDVAKPVLDLVRASRATDVDGLWRTVNAWAEIEGAKLAALDDDDVRVTARMRIDDTVAIVGAVAASCNTVDDVVRRIGSLCVNEDDLDRSKVAVFSSIHKAKGQEYDRVFLFEDSLYTDRRPDRFVDEQNLDYIATTRAKRELYLVRDVPGIKPR